MRIVQTNTTPVDIEERKAPLCFPPKHLRTGDTFLDFRGRSHWHFGIHIHRSLVHYGAVSCGISELESFVLIRIRYSGDPNLCAAVFAILQSSASCVTPFLFLVLGATTVSTFLRLSSCFIPHLCCY
jgi:hypothetical protein